MPATWVVVTGTLGTAAMPQAAPDPARPVAWPGLSCCWPSRPGCCALLSSQQHWGSAELSGGSVDAAVQAVIWGCLGLPQSDLSYTLQPTAVILTEFREACCRLICLQFMCHRGKEGSAVETLHAKQACCPCPASNGALSCLASSLVETLTLCGQPSHLLRAAGGMADADAASAALIARLQAQDAYHTGAGYQMSSDEEAPSDYEGERAPKRRKAAPKGSRVSDALVRASAGLGKIGQPPAGPLQVLAQPRSLPPGQERRPRTRCLRAPAAVHTMCSAGHTRCRLQDENRPDRANGVPPKGPGRQKRKDAGALNAVTVAAPSPADRGASGSLQGLSMCVAGADGPKRTPRGWTTEEHDTFVEGLGTFGRQAPLPKRTQPCPSLEQQSGGPSSLALASGACFSGGQLQSLPACCACRVLGAEHGPVWHPCCRRCCAACAHLTAVTAS